MSDLNEQLAAALQAYMDDHDVTKTDVARFLGRAKSYVGERLNGQRPLSLDIAGAVAELTHIQPSTLMVELSERMRRGL